MNCRKRHRVVRVAVALVVVTILTVAFSPQLALAISQRWYLTNTPTATEYVMQRGSPGSAGIITVLAGGNEIWVADEAASLPVHFPSGNWTGQITATPDSSTHDTNVEIGSWNGSTFALAGTSGTMSFPTKDTTSTLSFTITGASAINIPQGNWLALRFNNLDGIKTIDIEAGATSYVNSPSTDPGYPSPPWESYDDASQSNVWGTVANPYDSSYHTAHMYGQGFTPTHDYKIGYYDNSGNQASATESASSDSGGALTGAYDLMTDPGAAAGTWHSVVLDTTGDIPGTYAGALGDPAYVVDDEFEVLASAIPEFPTIFAAIGVAGLCFGIYWWMKRRLVYVKA